MIACLFEVVSRLCYIVFLLRGIVAGFDLLLDVGVGRAGLVEEFVVFGDGLVGVADRPVGLFAWGVTEAPGQHEY